MNSVIVLPEELDGGSAVICGVRAAYLYDCHELREGVECRASLLGGKRGKARVVSASRDRVALDVLFDLIPMNRLPVTLIAAVARPQTTKKVIQLAAAAGITALHFIRTSRVEKSYLQSRVLHPAEIRDEIIKGLEQTCDSLQPSISIHPEYWQVGRHLLPELNNSFPEARYIILHGTGLKHDELIDIGETQHVVIAIGPESGWTDAELSDFKDAGFETLSLGERILRVEHAAAYAISRVEYVRAAKSLASL